ncbi:putative ABC transport system permease protein [Flavobacterium arsenatis]|uniref:ABC transport system permease protein n=1 Tax=Flavobacterium arsenatis TaxID=1484332 RepID=A0ABU1TL11_9FLAO|nr:ABC transporter permease [Flavobacterium arsenatis]MDR6966664.1 putative ABC transport system permease protein [Flavobacterium arsenatis]
MLKNWLHIYLYQIKNNKFFTSLNILGLSIGIASLVFAILYWNDEKSYDAWNPNKERIFLLVNQIDENVFWTSGSAAVGPNLDAKSSEVESYCYLNDYYADEIIAAGGKKIQFSKILDAQRTFFEFFPFEFVEGNIKTAMPDENSICLSENTAQQLFKNEPAVGKEVVYSGKKLVVRGVYRLTGKAAYQPMAVVNFIDATLKHYDTQWGNFNFGLYIKAKKASDKDAILAKIDALNYENMTVVYAKKMGISVAEYQKKWGEHKVLLEPLSDVRLHTKSGGVAEGKGNYQFLLSMMGLSILILVLSVFNYINLATANAIKRAKEVGVRKVLGASKRNIVVQFIAEATLNVFVSILLALVIVELSLPYYNSFLDKILILNSETFFVQLLLILVVTIITAGVFPALYVSNFETLKVLKGNFGRSKAGIWLRNGMLVLQFAIASFFIVGSYIVYEQIDFMNKKDLGFKGDQVVDVVYRNIYGEGISNQMQYDKYLRIKSELLKIKGVKEVAGGTLGFGNGISSTISYNYKNEVINGQNVALDFGMLEMMDIKLKEGRFLDEKYTSDTIDKMLINETAMKLMKEKNPIGKEVDWNGKKMKIVGVVKDFNIEGPHNPIEAVSIFHFKNVGWLLNNLHNIYIKIDPETMDETVAGIEQYWLSKVDPDYPFVYDFVNKEYARSYGQFVKQRNLFSLLNVVVIVIALMGLFALASYSIQRRMKEIAIRKTLGAETKTLLKELSKQYILFCFIGFAIALFPVYFLLDKWLENFAYRIDISAIPFAIGFVALMVLTLIVVLSRAYQATRVDVLKYLKYE